MDISLTQPCEHSWPAGNNLLIINWLVIKWISDNEKRQKNGSCITEAKETKQPNEKWAGNALLSCIKEWLLEKFTKLHIQCTC